MCGTAVYFFDAYEYWGEIRGFYGLLCSPEVEYASVLLGEALVLWHDPPQQVRVKGDGRKGRHEPAVTWGRRRDEGRRNGKERGDIEKGGRHVTGRVVK